MVSTCESVGTLPKFSVFSAPRRSWGVHWLTKPEGYWLLFPKPEPKYFRSLYPPPEEYKFRETDLEILVQSVCSQLPVNFIPKNLTALSSLTFDGPSTPKDHSCSRPHGDHFCDQKFLFLDITYGLYTPHRAGSLMSLASKREFLLYFIGNVNLPDHISSGSNLFTWYACSGYFAWQLRT